MSVAAAITGSHLSQGSILSTFYAQLLHAQITKAQKRESSYQCLFALLLSACPKAATKMLVKFTPVVDFINILLETFTRADHKSTKRH